MPHQAKLLYEIRPRGRAAAAGPAIGRVFARLGEKKNRNRARLKFLVQKLGIDEFRGSSTRSARRSRTTTAGPSYLADVDAYDETPVREAVPACR